MVRWIEPYNYIAICNIFYIFFIFSSELQKKIQQNKNEWKKYSTFGCTKPWQHDIKQIPTYFMTWRKIIIIIILFHRHLVPILSAWHLNERNLLSRFFFTFHLVHFGQTLPWPCRVCTFWIRYTYIVGFADRCCCLFRYVFFFVESHAILKCSGMNSCCLQKAFTQIKDVSLLPTCLTPKGKGEIKFVINFHKWVYCLHTIFFLFDTWKRLCSFLFGQMTEKWKFFL